MRKEMKFHLRRVAAIFTTPPSQVKLTSWREIGSSTSVRVRMNRAKAREGPVCRASVSEWKAAGEFHGEGGAGVSESTRRGKQRLRPVSKTRGYERINSSGPRVSTRRGDHCENNERIAVSRTGSGPGRAGQPGLEMRAGLGAKEVFEWRWNVKRCCRQERLSSKRTVAYDIWVPTSSVCRAYSALQGPAVTA